jgi:hypothetical protein
MLSGVRGPAIVVLLTTGSPDLNVESRDTEFLAAGSHVLGSQHGGVGRGLVTIGLDLHAARHSADGFAATGITRVSLRTNFPLI